MDEFAKVIAAAFAGTVCVVLLKRNTPEIGFILTAFITIATASFGFVMLKELTGFISKAAEIANLPEEWLNPVMKTTGISVITKLSSDLIKDAGQNSIATAVELCGTITALYTALPLLNALLTLLSGLAR